MRDDYPIRGRGGGGRQRAINSGVVGVGRGEEVGERGSRNFEGKKRKLEERKREGGRERERES